VTVRKLDEIS